MIKRMLSLLFLCCGAFCANAAVQYMTVEQMNGEKFSFLLADKPTVAIENGNLVVNASAETSYALSGFRNFHFTEKDETSDVQDWVFDGLRVVALDGETIRIENVSASTSVKVVGADGVVWRATTTDASGSASFDLPQSKGVYVIFIGNQSFKFIRK